jgi:hypothetical protein
MAILRLAILATLSILSLASKEQDIRPLPQMWIEKDSCQGKINYFATQHYPKSSSKTKKEIFDNLLPTGGTILHPLYYDLPIDAFNSLVSAINTFDGVRIYFASYDQSNTPVNERQFMDPVTKNGQIVLIFTGTSLNTGSNDDARNYKDVGGYYVLLPNDKVIHVIGLNTKNSWVASYLKNAVGAPVDGKLASTIDNVRSNIYKNTILSDTRDVHYKKTDFLDFFQQEIKYQASSTGNHTHTNSIDGIRANFAAYNKIGIGANRQGIYHREYYKNRLLIVFQFLVNQKVLYLEDTDNFSERSDEVIHSLMQLHPNYKKTFIKKIYSGDNGQLCPYNCN